MSRGGVHNALSRGLLPSALSRALGDAEAESGLERYGETLTPTLNLWTQPEWTYLRREYLMSKPRTVGAVAGELGTCALINPTGSGAIVVVEGASFRYPAGVGTFHLQRAVAAAVTATLAFASRGLPRDTRAVETQPGIAEIWDGTDPGAIGVVLEEQTNELANAFRRFNIAIPMILSPGYAAVMQFGAVNLAVDFVFGWRERKAFPGELE